MRSIRVASFASIIAMAGTLGVIANAQEQAVPSSGIFVQSGAGQAELRLPSTRFELKTTNVGKSMATMGMMKPQQQGAFGGAKAPTRLPADATFRFQLEEKPASSSQNMSPQEMMAMMGGGGDGLPSMAKGPQDFALVKLTVVNDNREAHFGAVGSSHAKDTVDVIVENLSPHTFRVKPRHPLEPGEYAFYVRMGNSPMGQAWDFGVDQK